MAAFEQGKDLQIISKDIDKSKIKEEKLIRMKELFPEVDNDTLARYLLVRDGKVAPASEILRKALAWRKINLPIFKQEVVDQIALGKAYWHGYDKQGHPLLVSRPRMHDKNGCPLEMTGRATIWWLEHIISQIPPGMSKFSVLVDRTGATSANNDLEMVKAMQGVLNYVYPERLAKVIIHPTTVVFWSFFNIAKWFLDPVTREKICPCMYFYGVQEHIADEYIPATLGGGKCTYEFNHEDYVDAYPEEEVQRVLEQREQLYGPGVTTVPTSVFAAPDVSGDNTTAATATGGGKEKCASDDGGDATESST